MIHIILGTRSEVIKLSSIIREFERRKIDFKVIHTGQHDTLNLMELLKLPKPDFYLGKSFRDTWSKKCRFIAVMLALLWGFKVFLKLRRIFKEEEPNIIIYNGNTPAVPLTALAARTALFKKVCIVHRESGIRNNERFSEDDFYYRIGERFADILFCPSKVAVSNLKREKYTKNKKICYTQDPHVEIIKQILDLTISDSVNHTTNNYVLVNTVRSLDTDKKRLEFVRCLIESPFSIIYSINPRIKRILSLSNCLEKLQSENHIEVHDPFEYPSFLHLMKNSEAIMTDSGGVVAEAAILKKPCIILNDWSQYPELENMGLIKVTGINKEKILAILNDIKNKGEYYQRVKTSEYSVGDGMATTRMIDVIENYLINMR